MDQRDQRGARDDELQCGSTGSPNHLIADHERKSTHPNLPADFAQGRGHELLGLHVRRPRSSRHLQTGHITQPSVRFRNLAPCPAGIHHYDFLATDDSGGVPCEADEYRKVQFAAPPSSSSESRASRGPLRLNFAVPAGSRGSAACGAGGVMAWKRGGGGEGAEALDVGFALGMMCRGKPLKVAEPALPALPALPAPLPGLGGRSRSSSRGSR